MTLEETRGVIEAEFQSARQAPDGGNEGRVRVCARRAAGAAIGFWLQTNPGRVWGTDAMNRLRNLARTAEILPQVRDAASRLTARVTTDCVSLHATDPLDDARIIIGHLIGGKPF